MLVASSCWLMSEDATAMLALAPDVVTSAACTVQRGSYQ